ncbi:MAG TPA: arsenite methyltransferase [Dehalococcoidia bacterium]|nr:arsenite methyltransferase [Dehalococcoidia bacterium]
MVTRSKDIKDTVRERYGKIAEDVSQGASCCGPSGEGDPIVSNHYAQGELADIPLEAAMASLGCGNPVALAELNEGEVVLDLGSGGGIDVLLSAKRVGPTGKAYGLDMTDEMLALAEKNKAQSGLANVEFLKGEIEDIPLPDDSVDVIISNCVVNLSPDKSKVLAESLRVLKPGGRFAISDIVLVKPLPERVEKSVGAWIGCVAGALPANDYLTRLLETGFTSPSLEITRSYSGTDFGNRDDDLTEDERRQASNAYVSAFVRATKPLVRNEIEVMQVSQASACCGSTAGSSCC